MTGLSNLDSTLPKIQGLMDVIGDPSVVSLRLTQYPSPILKQKAEPFPEVDGKLCDNPHLLGYIAKMKKILTSIGGNGIGLAANQVGLLRRIFVCYADLNSEGKNKDLRAYINPVIVSNSGDEQAATEGCLSFPGVKGVVSRKPDVTIRYFNEKGELVEESSNGLQARCWLHEIDHLDGINIPDKFSEKDRSRNKALLDRLRKRG